MKICEVCKKEIKGFGTRFCSYACTDKARFNGKKLKCQNCGKDFYKSLYKINQGAKFCSQKCVSESHKNIICKRCGLKTEKYQQTSHCFNCFVQIQREKDSTRTINITTTGKNKEIKCVYCNRLFIRPAWYSARYCGRTCFYLDNKTKREGSKNPNWKGGFKYSDKHLKACSKYKKEFLKNNDYLSCELCGSSCAIRYETHHIIYASEAPKHKELHNFKNLILLCIGCHNNLHANKLSRKELVESRGLKELFK